jgi:hypothetical protein
MVSDLPGSPNFRHNDDQVLLDGSAEARTGSLNKEMGQTSVQPETYSNLEPTKQLSKNGSIFEERPMSEVVLTLPHLMSIEQALDDLYILLDKAGAPLELFDTVLRYIEKNLGKAFVPECRLPR